MGGGDIFGSAGRLASKTRENGGYLATAYTAYTAYRKIEN